MSGHVAVIIPFYQRTPGLLNRTLRGVFEQRDAPAIRVIIVDDGSPLPAADELGDLDPSSRETITVIRQANQGPATARNTGLAAVTTDAKWIALLDSDDLWAADHLHRAVTALQTHGNFYFSDGDVHCGGTTLFRHSGFDASRHRSIQGQDGLFMFVGDFLSLLIERTPLVTSSVVYRRDAFGHLKFNTDLQVCEDLAFWISVASLSPAVVFSDRVEVTGATDGEHISHIRDWRSNKALRLTRDLLRYYNFILDTAPVSDADRGRLREMVIEGRENIVITILAMVKDRVSIDRRLVLDCVRDSPAPVSDVVRAVIGLVRRRKT